jgi:isoquinoline 1-oxidoreductase beta subunit
MSKSTMNEAPQALSRRAFLKMTGIAAGGLVLGSVLPVSAPAWAHSGHVHGKPLNLFVTVEPSGRVKIVCHRSEMGQGIRTSIPQIVADELCVNWKDVQVVQGLANEAYGSQNTDGSRSIRRFYTTMREMGAMARTMLEQAAADKWSVPVSEVYAKDSFVVHKPSKKRISFGLLANDAAKVTPPATDTLRFKSKKDFKYIGKPMQIVDLPDIVTGNTIFGQDIKLDGMLYASIERNPVVGSKVEAFDKTAVMKTKDVVDVFQMPDQPTPVLFNPMNGVAVIAKNTWAALQGRKALSVKWGSSEHDSHDSDKYLAELNGRIITKGKSIRSRGDAYKGIEDAQKTVEATYTMP